MTTSESQFRHRAARYALTLPVRYRRPGDEKWTEGVSVNVSHTGVLFTTWGEVFASGEPVEFQMHLPAFHGLRGSDVQGTGRIVRTVAGLEGATRPAMAVQIDHYVFAPASVPSPGLRSAAFAAPKGWRRP